MRLLGAVAPKTEAGTMAGKPAARTVEAPTPRAATESAFRRDISLLRVMARSSPRRSLVTPPPGRSGPVGGEDMPLPRPESKARARPAGIVGCIGPAGSVRRWTGHVHPDTVQPLRQADLGGLRPARRAGDGGHPTGEALHLPAAEVPPRPTARPLSARPPLALRIDKPRAAGVASAGRRPSWTTLPGSATTKRGSRARSPTPRSPSRKRSTRRPPASPTAWPCASSSTRGSRRRP